MNTTTCFFCADQENTVTTTLDDRPECDDCYDVCTDSYYADLEEAR